MKICKKCHSEKPLDCFNHNKKFADGRDCWCKECYNECEGTANTLHKRYQKWKSMAKRTGREFSVTEKHLDAMPKTCYYTGMALTYACNEINTISLDRLDNDKGYIPGNVVFACSRINKMKSDLTYGQFILVCRTIVQHHDAK